MSTESVATAPKIMASKAHAIFMIVAGLVGWAASLALTIERFHLASDPKASLSCDVASFISCKSVMLSPEAKLFGFPNPVLGLAAFMAPVFIGFAILAGAEFKAWFWRLFFVGHTLGFVFVIWLSFEAIYDINALCPYCMVAWSAMIPLWWQLFFHGAREGYLPVPIKTIGFFVRAYDYAWVFALVTALAIVLEIAIHFWSLWMRLFGLV
ncbi:MAG: vitamin K epoxide reductase family protein [Micrococcales bacterium]